MRGFGWVAAGVVSVSILTAGCASVSPTPAPAAARQDTKDLDADPAPLFDEAGARALAEASTAFWARACDSKTILTTSNIDLYGKACKNGDADGCNKFGGAYTCGREVEKNGAVALAAFEKACALHDAGGCQVVAGAYLSGILGPRDLSRGLRVYQDSCKRGSSAACGSLGSMIMLMGKPEAKTRGIVFLERACSGDNPDGCGNLAVMESQGWPGHAPDAKRAASLSKAACENHSAFSCGVYGMLLMNGSGVAKDEAGAAKIFQLACDQGDANSCANLGKCAYLGVGVRQDTSRAAELLRKACDGGNGQGCRLLAELGTSGPPIAATPSPTMF